MIFGAKIVIILETKEYFTYNLVVWRIFIWSFGFVMFDFFGKDKCTSRLHPEPHGHPESLL